MSKQTLIIAPGAIGDSILAFQCAHFAKQAGEQVLVGVSARDDVFNIIHYVFSDLFDIVRLPEPLTSNHALLKESNPLDYLRDNFSALLNINKFYYVVPDLLFNNPYHFQYQAYGLKTPNIIKQQRLLLNSKLVIGQAKKIIYLAPHSSTPGYEYPDFNNLILALAESLSEYLLYLPKFTEWAGKAVFSPNDKVLKLPNLIYSEGFEKGISYLANSCYCISTCNGPSHLAYQFGVPRLVIDPQYCKLAWDSRWKEDVCECVSNLMTCDQLANIVWANLKTPQTLLIPRVYAFTNRDWQKELIIKEIQDL